MNKKLILCCLLSIFFCSSCNQVQPEWKRVVSKLAVEEVKILDLFFRTLIEETAVGYTLFGEKPLSIESIASSKDSCPTSFVFYDKHHKNMHLFHLGYEVLRSLPLRSSHYFFEVSEDAFCGVCELNIGNRKAIETLIGNNLLLFQYVLGPKFTVTDFLYEIETLKKSIYSIFHTDRVLIGTVLGYGVKNALMQSRFEYINEHQYDVAFLPLKSLDVKNSITLSTVGSQIRPLPFFHHQVDLPSFSFSTLAEEVGWLQNGGRSSLSRSMEGSVAAFPWFGYWDSEESRELIESYQKTQQYLNEILNSEKFLEIVLERIFGS